MVIDVNPEFGYEIACAIPYAYWLHERGELEKVITSKGMKPFYYFCDNVEEKYDFRTVDNGAAGLNSLPNNWIHHNAKAVMGKEYGDLSEEERLQTNGVLDYSQWKLPPYKDYYKDDKFKFEKPMIVISNKIVMDHSKEPHAYFDLKTLYEIFNYLTENDYCVVYKRPKMKEFAIDQNEQSTLMNGYDIKANVEGIGEINDHELTKYYDDVYLIDDIVSKNENYNFNEVQLRIFANADGFISIAGGNSIFCSCFGKKNVTYVTTSGELRDNYFQKNGYYCKLSNSDVIPVRDPETEIIKRGYNDYESLLNKIKEVY
jgi:hypothetical protein